MSYDPAAIIRGALKALEAEDLLHRQIKLEAVEAEVQKMLGGCRCERTAREHDRTVVKACVWHDANCESCVVTKQNDPTTMRGAGATIAEAFGRMTEAN